MLETAHTLDIVNLMARSGKASKSVDVGAVAVGTIINVRTYSGSSYLFEIVDPVACLAHVVRCPAPSSRFQSGYRGLRVVSRFFQTDKQILHGLSVTSPVEKIILLKIKPLS